MRAEPNPVDIEIGRRLRESRSRLGISQERLAAQLGVSYQQVQKYERGANRIGSGRLHDIARFLQVPVTYFFEGVNDDREQPQGLADAPAPFAFDGADQQHLGAGAAETGNREVLDLVRVFTRIADPMVRRRIYELAKTLAEAQAVPRDPRGA